MSLLSWLHVSFFLHVKYTVSYHILSYIVSYFEFVSMWNVRSSASSCLPPILAVNVTQWHSQYLEVVRYVSPPAGSRGGAPVGGLGHIWTSYFDAKLKEMLAIFDIMIPIVTNWNKLATKGVCHRIPYDRLMYVYHDSLVTVWYCVVCCNGTLYFLPHHQLPSKKAQMQLGEPAANAFMYILNP